MDVSLVGIQYQLVLVRIIANVTKPRFALFWHVDQFDMSSGIVFSGKLGKANSALKLITSCCFLNIITF